MADIPSTSTSRVGRPRTRSVHQIPCVPVVKPKVGRPRSKSAHASKITDSSKNTKVKKTSGRPPKQVKVVPPPEQRVIEIDSDNSDKDFPFHPERLPDLPPVELEQINPPNQQVNIPAGEGNQQDQAEQLEPNQVSNQPLDAPVEEPNQPNQPPNLPHLMANPQQLNWSYFKPDLQEKQKKMWRHICSKLMTGWTLTIFQMTKR